MLSQSTLVYVVISIIYNPIPGFNRKSSECSIISLDRESMFFFFITVVRKNDYARTCEYFIYCTDGFLLLSKLNCLTLI
jgi:hypothetical protein